MDIKTIMKNMAYGTATEDSTIVQQWLDTHADMGFGHYINGQFVHPKNADMFPVINPATNAVIATCTQGTYEAVDMAVTSAKTAFGLWSKTSGHTRAKYLYAMARHMQKHARFLSVLETVNNGKTIRESRDIDIPTAIRHVYHHAGWAEVLASEFPNHQPLGVCGQIIPWNFPLLMLVWKIAPALASGNTVVLKPAEYTPLTAMAIADICHAINLPKGVVNIVNGNGETGNHIVQHPKIAKIAFTGSTAVGRKIRKKTAGTGKKLTLELGGKSPFIVFDDADMDGAIEGVVDAIWFNTGEVCCAGSRLLIQETIAPEFIRRLKHRMETLRVGNPLDKCMDMGAIVHPHQHNRIMDILRTAKKDGVTVHQPSCPMPDTGNFCPPTLCLNSGTNAFVMREEIFGPVVSVLSFRTPDEAITLANNTPYGLSASVWSENINTALDLASHIKAGVIWINSTNMFDANAGFGGMRESGFGREGGKEGMLAYLKHTAETLKTPPEVKTPTPLQTATNSLPEIPHNVDRTAKFYIGGKQTRPDSGYSMAIKDTQGNIVDWVGYGNRKDIRNAVESAAKSTAWSNTTGHHKAQVLYYIAENLDQQRSRFIDRLCATQNSTRPQATAEIDATIARIFYYGAMADKFDGAVHNTVLGHVTTAMYEPFGVVGVTCPNASPLLGFVSVVMPLVSTGNRTVVIASETNPLLATDFYQILETSDIPAGVINIVCGDKDALSETLSKHDGVDCMWYFGNADGGKIVEQASAGNLKPTWTHHTMPDWYNTQQGQGRRFLQQATQIKNIWIPYGA